MSTLILLLFLIIVANGAPVLAYDLLKDRWAWSVDGNTRCPDGRRVFGPSKTIRGILFSLVATSVCAFLLRQPLSVGLILAATAMAGDLISSFVKRRLGKDTGSQALGIDQIPEVLFPLLAVKSRYGLSVIGIIALVVGFIIFELAASRFLFKVHLRKHPY